MMLTTKGRYAVMALVDIACQQHENPVRLAEITNRQHIPLNYLEQIFSKLRKANLVLAIKGPGGGYMLAHSNITILEIIEAVEENVQMTRCANNSENGCMPDNAKCKTHHLWAGLTNHIKSYLNDIKLQDIIKNNEIHTSNLNEIISQGTQNEYEVNL